MDTQYKFSNEELFVAESVADYLELHEELSDQEIKVLLEFRKDTLCDRSFNQQYQCNIQTSHGYCCDTCLQSELHHLWAIGIITKGSCCGHGGKYQPFIQVLSDDHVKRMIEMGYEQIPVDKNGYGENAFKPKTRLIESIADYRQVQGRK